MGFQLFGFIPGAVGLRGKFVSIPEKEGGENRQDTVKVGYAVVPLPAMLASPALDLSALSQSSILLLHLPAAHSMASNVPSGSAGGGPGLLHMAWVWPPLPAGVLRAASAVAAWGHPHQAGVQRRMQHGQWSCGSPGGDGAELHALTTPRSPAPERTLSDAACCLCIVACRIGPPSSVVLKTTYVDDRVRLGKGSRGSLFVFTRGGAADEAGEHREGGMDRPAACACLPC